MLLPLIFTAPFLSQDQRPRRGADADAKVRSFLEIECWKSVYLPFHLIKTVKFDVFQSICLVFVVEWKNSLYICNRKTGFVNIRSLNLSYKATEIQSEMMKSDEGRIYLKHDTMMCDASKVWFPMRVTYLWKTKIRFVDYKVSR